MLDGEGDRHVLSSFFELNCVVRGTLEHVGADFVRVGGRMGTWADNVWSLAERWSWESWQPFVIDANRRFRGSCHLTSEWKLSCRLVRIH